VGQAYQLEDSSDRYLLEDGSGVWLLEEQDVSLALTGQQIDSGHGRIRADWPIISAGGQPLVAVDVALAGLSSTSASGTLTADVGSPDRTEALSGLEAVSTAGLLAVASTVDATGLSSTSAIGSLNGTLDVAGVGLSVTVDHGLFGPTSLRTLSGLDSAGALGTLAVTDSRGLDGLESLGSLGTVTPLGDLTVALAGEAVVASAGLLTASGGDVDDAGALFALQRQRHFGRSSLPLVRQPYPRKVR